MNDALHLGDLCLRSPHEVTNFAGTPVYLFFVPTCWEHAEVAAVAPLSGLLSSVEELSSLLWVLLHHTGEANLTLQVVLELIPLWLFAIQWEWVLTLCLERWVITPQVPVTALNRTLNGAGDNWGWCPQRLGQQHSRVVQEFLSTKREYAKGRRYEVAHLKCIRAIQHQGAFRRFLFK